MKVISVLLVTFSTLAFGQNQCKPFLPNKEGAKWEITSYSAKGKASGVSKYTLVRIAEEGGLTRFTIKSTYYDSKGEEVFNNEFDAECEDGIFRFDMAFQMNSESMKAYEDMEVDVDASDYVLPSMDAAPGTNLDDGTMIISVGQSGISMKITMLITERKVESRETIKTAAGEFDCIVLSQKVSTKMMVKVEGASKEWYSPEVGMVRSESYNKKGKLVGYSELTKLEL